MFIQLSENMLWYSKRGGYYLGGHFEEKNAHEEMEGGKMKCSAETAKVQHRRAMVEQLQTIRSKWKTDMDARIRRAEDELLHNMVGFSLLLFFFAFCSL